MNTNDENRIVSEFYSSFEAFYPSFNAISFEYIHDKKEITARIYFNHFIIDFVYIIKGFAAVGPRSILECRVWLNKSEKHLYFSLYDLMFLIDQNNFKCYFYPFIESPDKMKRCFSELAGEVRELIPKIAEIALDTDKVQLAYNVLKTNITSLFDKTMFDLDDQLEPHIAEYILESSLKRYYQWVGLRFASKCYSDFLDGNYRKSAKKYSSYKKRLEYEDRLLEFMKSIPEGQKYQAVNPELNTLRDGLKEQAKISELFILFLSWLILTMLLFPLYLGLYYLFLHINSWGALYSTGYELYNAFVAVLPAFLASIGLSYFTRRLFYKICYRKNLQKRLDYDALFNAKSESRFMKVLVYILFLGSLIGMALAASRGISFYEYSFKVDNAASFDIKGTVYSYDSLDSVWRIEGRYNDFDEWLDNPSYVLVFKDGDKIDLYEYLEYSDSEKKILPILKKHNIPVLNAKSTDRIKPKNN